MVDLADRLGAAGLATGHYARIVDDGGGPAAGGGRRPRQGPELHAGRRCRRAARAGCASRSPSLTQAAGAGDRRAPRPAGRPQAREPGPLLPRRPGQARVPAPPRRPRGPRRRRRSTARAAGSAATAATTTSPSASAAGSASPRPSRSTCSPPTPTRNTVTVGAAGRARDATEVASATRSCTAPGEAGRRGSAALPLRAASPAAFAAPTRPADYESLRRSSSGEPFAGAGAGPGGACCSRRDDRRPRHDRRQRSQARRLPPMTSASEIRETYLSYFARARAQDRALGLAGALACTTPRCC